MVTEIMLKYLDAENSCYHNNHFPPQLDTLVRVLVDRKWTVGQLARAVLKFARQKLNEPHVIPDNHSLFDELIGIEKIPDDT